MTKRILITGSEGTIGRVLTGRSETNNTNVRLSGEITRLDIGGDRGGEGSFYQSALESPKEITSLLRDHDALVHCAWAGEGILSPSSSSPENRRVIERILECAANMGKAASKLILLSSVNAHVPQNWRERQATGQLIDPREPATPFAHNTSSEPMREYTQYGRSKLIIEEMAHTAVQQHNLAISVPRIGGVNIADQQPSTYPPFQRVANDPTRGKYLDLEWEDAVRLRHHDLVAAIQSDIDTDRHIDGRPYNLVSDNPGRVHLLED